MQSLRSRLEEKIQNRHLLSHSFYTRWQQGKLTHDELQGYAKEYFAFESEFPRFLSAIHSRCENSSVRQALLENLIHEEQGLDNHQELWLKFADGMGACREDVKNHFRSDETEHLLSVFRKHCQSGNPIDGITALYAYERQQPDVARTKTEGLRSFYGVSDESTVNFFKVHQSVDVYHAETGATLLTQLCKSSEDEERALNVAEETLNALYIFLDGVERRYSQPRTKFNSTAI
mgnify:FL=1